MIKAQDIMSGNVITVTESTTIEELGRLFIEKSISGAPVVDASGNLTGIVTENDLISKASRLHIPTIFRLFDAYIPLGTSRLEKEIQYMTASTVGEVCSRKVVTVSGETPIDQIATIMRDRNIHLIPVVQEGKVIGIIGKKDIIRGIAGEASQ